MKPNRINIPALKVRSNSTYLTTLAVLLLFVYLLFPASGSMQKQTDFSAGAGGAFISGSVAADGAALPGATVVLRGAQNLSTTTDAGGNYFFPTASSTGNYTVTVSKNGFVLTPANQSVTLSGGGQSNVNFTGAPLCAPPSTGLVGWWKGENNVFDSAGFGNNGSLSGVIGYATGKAGQAFNAGGNDGQIIFPDSPSVSITGELTLQAWVYPHALDDASGHSIISKYANGNQLSWYFGTNGANGILEFGVYQNGDASVARRAATTGSVIAVNQWTLVTATFNPTTQEIKIYANGAEAPSTITVNGTVTSIFDSNSPVQVGAYRNGAGTNLGFFDGLIDEAQIYRRALSASEVAAIYQAGSAGVCGSGAVFTNSNPNGKIAFSGWRAINNEIVSMNADGSNQTNLTGNIAGDDQPSWSPDGSKIAFVSFRNNNFDVFTMNADGSNQTRLTIDASDDQTPNWSPDGTKIVFNSKRTGGGDIYVMSADGSNQTRLTTDINSDTTPKFSPDGTKIVFGTNRNGNYEVYLMNADGTGSMRLTNNAAFDGVPAFSPDGSKIAFHSTRTGVSQIFVMNADGTNQVNISNNSADDGLAAWSSDGTKIVFDSSRDSGNGEIYTMNADGSNPTRLTNNFVSDYFSAWQTSTGIVSVTPASNINLTFANAITPGNTVATALAADQLPILPIGYTPLAGTFAYDVRTSAVYTGNINVSYRVPNVADAQTCSRLRIVHFENGAWSPAANNQPPQFNAGTLVCTVAQNVTSLSPFAVVQLPGPTAANVSVGGRVLTAGGNGIRNVTVSLTDMQGNTRTALSSSFGYYRFDDVPAGETVIVTAIAKRYTFARPQQILHVLEDANDVDFAADDSVFLRER